MWMSVNGVKTGYSLQRIVVSKSMGYQECVFWLGLSIVHEEHSSQ